jgi:hypothetical protein
MMRAAESFHQKNGKNGKATEEPKIGGNRGTTEKPEIRGTEERTKGPSTPRDTARYAHDDTSNAIQPRYAQDDTSNMTT